MKFFHLSDLHIGLKLYNRDLCEDQEYIFRQICQAAAEQQPDAVIIAGDVYDKAIPSAEAVGIFDRFVSGLAAAVPEAEIMIISGNHDSAARINTFRRILSRQKLHMIGQPPRLPEEFIEKVTLQDGFGPVNFYLLPFVKPSMVRAIAGTEEDGRSLSYNESLHRLLSREEICQTQRNVLVSHQFYLPLGVSPEGVERMDSELRTVGNIDEIKADVLTPFDYAALGHIHKPMKVGSDRYRYCGTPLACSVSEAGQQKEILCVNLGKKGDVRVDSLPLTPLRQVKTLKGSLSQVLEQACDDYVSILLTDKADLDVIEMQDRLRDAFPNLLEIQRELLHRPQYRASCPAGEALDPFGLCMDFLHDLDEEEQTLLRDIINTVQEVQE